MVDKGQEKFSYITSLHLAANYHYCTTFACFGRKLSSKSKRVPNFSGQCLYQIIAVLYSNHSHRQRGVIARIRLVACQVAFGCPLRSSVWNSSNKSHPWISLPVSSSRIAMKPPQDCKQNDCPICDHWIPILQSLCLPADQLLVAKACGSEKCCKYSGHWSKVHKGDSESERIHQIFNPFEHPKRSAVIHIIIPNPSTPSWAWFCHAHSPSAPYPKPTSLPNPPPAILQAYLLRISQWLVRISTRGRNRRWRYKGCYTLDVGRWWNLGSG